MEAGKSKFKTPPLISGEGCSLLSRWHHDTGSSCIGSRRTQEHFLCPEPFHKCSNHLLQTTWRCCTGDQVQHEVWRGCHHSNHCRCVIGCVSPEVDWRQEFECKGFIWKFFPGRTEQEWGHETRKEGHPVPHECTDEQVPAVAAGLSSVE